MIGSYAPDTPAPLCSRVFTVPCAFKGDSERPMICPAALSGTS